MCIGMQLSHKYPVTSTHNCLCYHHICWNVLFWFHYQVSVFCCWDCRAKQIFSPHQCCFCHVKGCFDWRNPHNHQMSWSLHNLSLCSVVFAVLSLQCWYSHTNAELLEVIVPSYGFSKWLLECTFIFRSQVLMKGILKQYFIQMFYQARVDCIRISIISINVVKKHYVWIETKCKYTSFHIVDTITIEQLTLWTLNWLFDEPINTLSIIGTKLLEVAKVFLHSTVIVHLDIASLVVLLKL